MRPILTSLDSYNRAGNELQCNADGLQQHAAPERAASVAPVQKPPLPEEYVGMQTVFDTIRTECSNRAVNAVIYF